MDAFNYHQGRLFAEDVDLTEIAAKYGQKRASVAIGRDGRLFTFSLSQNQYILDSRLRETGDVEEFFKVLEN